jgi:signal transduction histidine kinase
MVDVMGGELTVNSEEGRGSTFTVDLQAAEPTSTPVA